MHLGEESLDSSIAKPVEEMCHVARTIIEPFAFAKSNQTPQDLVQISCYSGAILLFQ